MANLPDDLYEDYSSQKLTLPSAYSFAPTTTVVPVIAMETVIYQMISDFRNKNPLISDFALQSLVNHRNTYEILPLLLWESRYTMLQKIVEVYPHIFRPVHSQDGRPPRAYNVLLLFQCIAQHPETRGYFLKAELAQYLFPLMDINLADKPLECLRLGALGVLAHMLMAPIDGAAVRFLLDNVALHYCTKAIQIGSTESKTVSVFILNKILSTNEGLKYWCILVDRFLLIDSLLKMLLVYLYHITKPCPSLFNLVVGCYAKLSQKPRAREVLWLFPPVMLHDRKFASLFAEDPDAVNYHRQLSRNMQIKAMKQKKRRVLLQRDATSNN